ncbi:hypothetical protein NXS08_03205 [Gleimia sp. 6138-11-ORH1]|uniref:hypothetical protein n=1 Tax=Gleimia sp. 6138-11-ORH1 TaxID=2973937 RepID=UPI002168172B|nr:hypothetical protein [Gleimia sp. 6138-11-ORH1]MCS4484496.1 hypothetical protein [Gleimia sp. 6138-11-ORH1]
MLFDYSDRDLSHPFSVVRSLIEDLDQVTGSDWRESHLARCVFHRAGRSIESLSEQQKSEDQLRYYTVNRILRGLRRIAVDYSTKITGPIFLTLASMPSEPDKEFLLGLADNLEVQLSIKLSHKRNNLKCDSIVQEQNAILAKVRSATITPEDLAKYVSQLLTYGDSWNAKDVADAYLQQVEVLDPKLADLLGIPYALQGDVGMAKLLWVIWCTLTPIDEARARYSLAMLYARHNPRALLDVSVVERHL